MLKLLKIAVLSVALALLVSGACLAAGPYDVSGIDIRDFMNTFKLGELPSWDKYSPRDSTVKGDITVHAFAYDRKGEASIVLWTDNASGKIRNIRISNDFAGAFLLEWTDMVAKLYGPPSVIEDGGNYYDPAQMRYWEARRGAPVNAAVAISPVTQLTTMRVSATKADAVYLVKSLYQEGNSKAFIPQVRGMSDTALQTRINDNLRSAILALKNEAADSSLRGDFEVSFYNANLLGIHFKGTSYTPGASRPNKIDRGIHIDLASGEVYDLAALFKQGADFDKRVKELCAANDSAYRLKIDGLAESWTNKTFTSSWTGQDRAFLLAADSVRVYSVPSYALGPISGYAVPYADLADIIDAGGKIWQKLKIREALPIAVTAE